MSSSVELRCLMDASDAPLSIHRYPQVRPGCVVWPLNVTAGHSCRSRPAPDSTAASPTEPTDKRAGRQRGRAAATRARDRTRSWPRWLRNSRIIQRTHLPRSDWDAPIIGPGRRHLESAAPNGSGEERDNPEAGHPTSCCQQRRRDISTNGEHRDEGDHCREEGRKGNCEETQHEPGPRPAVRKAAFSSAARYLPEPRVIGSAATSAGNDETRRTSLHTHGRGACD